MLQIHPLAFTEGKLDGMNYTLWKFKVATILDSCELLETVLGANSKPLCMYKTRKETSYNLKAPNVST